MCVGCLREKDREREREREGGRERESKKFDRSVMQAACLPSIGES